MATFAERMGLREKRTLIQSAELDEETRTGLWNILVILRGIFDERSRSFYGSPTEDELLNSL